MLWACALRPTHRTSRVTSLSNTRSLGENLGPRTRLGERDLGPGTRSGECDPGPKTRPGEHDLDPGARLSVTWVTSEV